MVKKQTDAALRETTMFALAGADERDSFASVAKFTHSQVPGRETFAEQPWAA